MVQQGLSNLRDSLAQHTMEWEAQQRVAYRTDAVQSHIASQTPLVEAHPELADQVGSTLMDEINALGGDPSTRLRLARQMDQQVSMAAANGTTRQDPAGMLAALKDPENAPPNLRSVINNLSDEQREQVMSGATSHLASNYSDSVVNVYRSQGPTAGGQALAAIDKIDQPDAVKSAIYANVERGLAQWHAEARQTHAQDIIGLETRLASGQPDPQDQSTVWSLYHAGALTPDQVGDTIGRLQKAQIKQVDDDAWRASITDAYKNSQPLDPHDKDVKAGVADLFNTATKGVQPGSVEWTNRAADIAQRTGVTPDPVISWARPQLVSGNPQVAAQAAEVIQRVSLANPRGTPYAFEGDPRSAALAKMINDAVTAGTDPTTAVENARTLSSLPEVEAKRLNDLYKRTGKPTTDLTAELKALPQYQGGGAFGGTTLPQLPPTMIEQFASLENQYFKLTGGNSGQASDLAMNDLKNTWGITAVNGKREFMQYAPEAMYPGLTADAIRADMAASVVQAGPYDASKVRLTPTSDTANTQGRVWGLSVPDQFGAYDVIRGSDNRPIRYQIPDAMDSLRAMHDKLAAEGMAKARSLQENDRVAHEAEYEAFSQHEGRAPVLGY
jgi:hypothetical protein